MTTPTKPPQSAGETRKLKDEELNVRYDELTGIIEGDIDFHAQRRLQRDDLAELYQYNLMTQALETLTNLHAYALQLESENEMLRTEIRGSVFENCPFH